MKLVSKVYILNILDMLFDNFDISMQHRWQHHVNHLSFSQY